MEVAWAPCSAAAPAATLYTYAHGSPATNRDPNGEFVIKIPFTSVYFYAEPKKSGGGLVGMGFTSSSELSHRYPKLQGLTPDMRDKAEPVLTRIEGQGWQPRLAEGLRTPAQQAKKVAEGNSKTMKSRHLDQGGKGAEAMDVVDKRWGWQDSGKEAQLFFRSYGEIGKDEGLVWGGDWKPINKTKGYGWDPAHTELPRKKPK